MSDATKACPYCGEQILAVAVKCKHCGSALGGVGTAVKRQFKLRPAFAVLGIIILAIVGAAWVYNWSQTGSISGGFTDADISQIEKDIRAEYVKKGFTVTDVKMLQESPKKLTGFVKLKMPLLGEVPKNCTATMYNNGQSMWQCQ